MQSSEFFMSTVPVLCVYGGHPVKKRMVDAFFDGVTLLPVPFQHVMEKRVCRLVELRTDGQRPVQDFVQLDSSFGVLFDSEREPPM